MQFNEQVLEVLSNFATINQSIVFKPGDVIETMSPMKSMLAKAKTNITFTSTFGIYELPKFLALLSKFENPTLELQQGFVLVKGAEGEEADFTVCEPSLVITPPEKGITLPSKDVEFKLTADVLKRAQNVVAILSTPQTAFTGKDGKLFVEGVDVKNSSSHRYRRQVGETDKTFRMVFETENLKVLPRDYDVAISAKGLSHFEAVDVEYWIAVEASSTFGG